MTGVYRVEPGDGTPGRPIGMHCVIYDLAGRPYVQATCTDERDAGLIASLLQKHWESAPELADPPHDGSRTRW